MHDPTGRSAVQIILPIILAALGVVGCGDRVLSGRLARMERRVDSLAVTVTAMNAFIQRNGLNGGTAKPESVTVDATGESLGSPNAPVTIVEFTDFQCPFCGRHATETFPLLRAKYIATGRVRYVVRDFPLSQIHPFALPAARAARCAGAEGAAKFWIFHDSLFAHQRDLGDLYFTSLAHQAGLYESAFKACVASGKFDAAIAADASAASKAGFDGTPGFVVGKARPDGTVRGVAIRGAYPIERFDAAIEAAAGPSLPRTSVHLNTPSARSTQ